jgi:hypothetical protein
LDVAARNASSVVRGTVKYRYTAPLCKRTVSVASGPYVTVRMRDESTGMSVAARGMAIAVAVRGVRRG